MGSSVQPQSTDPVAAYLQKYGKGGGSGMPPVPASTPDPVSSYLQKYGNNANDNLRDGMLGGIQKGAEAIVSGFPGAERAVAGYRGLLSLLSGQGLDAAANEVQSTMNNARQHVAALPATARIPAQIAGSIPAAVALAPLGLIGGGAAFGAAAGADKPADTFTDRIKNTALGAGVGAVASKGAQVVGNGLANIADRTGLTDVVGRALSKVAPNISATLGTEGQVNNVLSDRQDILDNIGDTGDTGAQQQMARIAATKAQAKTLYDAAREDQAPIQNPRLQELLADPRIAKSYQTIASTLEQSPNPLPTPTTNTVLSPRDDGLLSPDDIAAASSAFDQAYGKAGGPTTALPDPRALSLLKRELYNVAQGKLESPLPIKQEEAQQLMPLVDEIRTQLHASSPAWQQADQFYAQAKGQEDAFAHGFDAFRMANNQTGATLPTNSPEAMLQTITEPRYPGEPPEAMADRADAFRAGAKSAAVGQVQAEPVDRGLQSVLSAKALAPTQPGMQTRSLMFDQPEDAQTLEQTLAKLRGQSQALPGGDGNNLPPASRSGVIRYLVRKVTTTPDLLQSPQGQQALMARLANPDLLQQGITAAQQGNAALSPFQQAIQVALGGQATR